MDVRHPVREVQALQASLVEHICVGTAAALERTGFQPTYGLSGGGADANVFNERGLQCLNLANGMTDIHTPDERIAVADLDRMVDVTLALVEVARDDS